MRKIKASFIASFLIIGVFLIGSPSELSAATHPSGTLIKCTSLSTVYFISSQEKRHAFPNEATYFSWYDNFDSVVTVEDSVCPEYSLGTNVTAKPGSILWKLPSLTEVYAIEAPNILRHIASESVAVELFGENWSKTGGEGPMRDLAETFYANYQVGDPIILIDQYQRDTAQGACASIDDCLDVASRQSVYNRGKTNPDLIFQRGSVADPALGLQNIDPIYTTIFKKITGDNEYHHSANFQAFNADSTMVLLEDDDGYFVRSLSTFNRVLDLPEDIHNPRWNPANKDEVIFFDSNDVSETFQEVIIQKQNVLSGVITDYMTLPVFHTRVSEDASWGSLSRDGKWLTALIHNRDDDRTFISFNLETKTISTSLDLGNLELHACVGEPPEPLWVSASPLGRYMVVAWDAEGTERVAERCTGVEAYDINTGQYKGHLTHHRHNGDLGLDHNGKEIYVTTYVAETLKVGLTYLPGTKEFTNGFDKIILNAGYGHANDISCQGMAGMCVVTGGKNGGGAFSDEVYLVYTMGNVTGSSNSGAIVRRMINHRSSYCPGAEPAATLSADGNYILYDSDWGTCNEPVNSYIIEL